MKALIIDLKNQAIFFPEDVEKVKDALEGKFHIYAILLSHKYYLNIDKVEHKKEGIILPVFSTTNPDCFTIPFKVDQGLDHTLIRVDSQYPYEKFSVTIEDENWKSKNPDKECYIEYNLTKISDKVSFQHARDLKYKLLYIGQSYGKAGERAATDRLQNHSTLQKILAECQNKYTGYNIHILLFQFEQDQIVAEYTCNNQPAFIVPTPHFDEQQIINITEAALIHYFKPEYNKVFISVFPSDNHTSYSDICKAGCTELVLDLSYLFEAEHYPSLSLYTDSNSIINEKRCIHYQLKESKIILSSYPLDND